jgi:AraC-like DNA-binding protein
VTRQAEACGASEDPVRQTDGSFRLGPEDAPKSAELFVGYCVFGAPDSTLLMSLLPRVIHIRGLERLTTIVQLVGEETASRQPGQEAILARLLEVLMIEALRATHERSEAPGLLRGLADERLSRTAFFERFRNTVGVAPMEHLTSWRMAIAKRLLREHRRIGEVAENVVYGSTAAFATAFRRRFGMSSMRFSRSAEALFGRQLI